MDSDLTLKAPLNSRFRGFFPVVIDVETGGLEARTDALLELAAVTLTLNDVGQLVLDQVFMEHIVPFEGSKLQPEALAFNKIDPFHPFRFAISEQEALKKLFKLINQAKKAVKCQRAVLVGHNAWFDLSFLNAAIARTQVKQNPFHAFTCFDTATLSGIFYGQTVLSRAMHQSGIEFDSKEAHSAKYDAVQTAKLFCNIVNLWYEKKDVR